MEIMLDLETLGTEPGCPVLSIGAAAFRLGVGEGPAVGSTFDAFIELQPQLDAGLKVSASTLQFWLGADDDARKAITEGQKRAVSPHRALQDFESWVRNVQPYNDKGVEGVWGHGATFDIPVYAALAKVFGRKEPWHYRAPRDTRTLFAMAAKTLGDFGNKAAVKHDALADAIAQAQEVVACWEFVKGPR